MNGEKISNAALAGLVVLAILVSVTGTVTTLNAVGRAPGLGQAPSAITGAAGTQYGVAKLNVSPAVAITLPVSEIDFGLMANNEINDTTDDNPPPFMVQNDGTVKVNITLKATDLFSGTGAANPSLYYQFKAGNSTEANSFNWAASQTTWAYMPDTTTEQLAIAELEFTDTKDLAELEIYVKIPGDESVGSKSSTVTFTASQA